jgi:Fe-S-cluster containining protein
MADAGALSTKELLWLSCREKTCCHNSRVIVTGLDMWRISQALDLAPWEFTMYTDAVEGAPDAFQLEPGGRPFQVILAKRGEVGPHGAPCIFLWKLADGHAQCGLGALRPLVCLSYPAVLVDDMLRVEGGHCTCRRWSLLDLDAGRELALIEQLLAEAAAYGEMVAAWNEQLHDLAETRPFRDFCAYILEACSRSGGGVP